MQCGPIGIALIGVFAISACQSQSALQQHLADEQLMTAQTYSDVTWNWGHVVPGGPRVLGSRMDRWAGSHFTTTCQISVRKPRRSVALTVGPRSASPSMHFQR